jgi:hypothetical protein
MVNCSLWKKQFGIESTESHFRVDSITGLSLVSGYYACAEVGILGFQGSRTNA